MRVKPSKKEDKSNKSEKKAKTHPDFAGQNGNGAGDYCNNEETNNKVKEDEKKKQKNKKIADKHSNKEQNVCKTKQNKTEAIDKKQQVQSAENCKKNTTETCNEAELNRIAKERARKIAEKHFPQIKCQFIEMLNGKFEALAKSLEETGKRAKEERKKLKLETKNARDEMTVEIVKKIAKQFGSNRQKVKETLTSARKIPIISNSNAPLVSTSCCNSAIIAKPRRRLKLPSASLQIIEEEYFVPLRDDVDELYCSRPWTDSTISDSFDSTDED